MKIFKTALAVGCTTICMGLPSIAVSQSSPDVSDSPPKRVLEQQAAEREAEAKETEAEEAEVEEVEAEETEAEETEAEETEAKEAEAKEAEAKEAEAKEAEVEEAEVEEAEVEEVEVEDAEAEDAEAEETEAEETEVEEAEAEEAEAEEAEAKEAEVEEAEAIDTVVVDTPASEPEDIGIPANASVGPVIQGSSPMGIDMIIINPGTGKLGSPETEEKRARFENTLRETEISYRFEVSKFEITFDEWEKCINDGGCAGHKPDDKGWGRGKRPVINVSYDDAQNFLKWVNQKTGEDYRLLSEAEWEYVARAGQDGPFGTGFDMSAKFANFDGSAPYGSGVIGPYLRKTQSVGQYEPNAFGIYDMHGNVYEWVEDCWNADHSGAVGDGSPRKDGDCSFRIMKGGSWVTHGYQTRAAARIRYVTDYRYDDYGFRIARTLN